MSDKETPSYLKEGDGFVDITLAKPADFGGEQRSVLRMREPSVEDQLAASNVKGSSGAQEIAMIANLCEVTPDDIRALKLRNYSRLQAGVMLFID